MFTKKVSTRFCPKCRVERHKASQLETQRAKAARARAVGLSVNSNLTDIAKAEEAVREKGAGTHVL